MQARWYLASIGRFASADTIVPDPASPQDLNRYAYVRNSPVKYQDPTGHEVCNIDGDCSAPILPAYPGPPEPSGRYGPEIDNLKPGWLEFLDPLRPLPDPTPGQHFRAGHRAVDYPGAEGTSIYSPTQGLVVLNDRCALNNCDDLSGQFGTGDPNYAKINGGYGNVVIVEYGYRTLSLEAIDAFDLEPEQSLFVLLAHLEEPSEYEIGDIVDSQDVVGMMGSSGNSTGPHLHTEIRIGQTGQLWAHSLCTTECGGDAAPAWNTWFSMQAVDPEKVWR